MTVEHDETPLLVVDAADVQERVGPAVALEAARRAAASRLDDGTRVGRVQLPIPGGWMRILGAAIPSIGAFGYKEFHLSGNGSVRYAVHVFAVSDGRPLGVVDGSVLTPLRTAATAAAAATCSRQLTAGALTVGVIGSGAEARAGLRALHDALSVAGARVLSRSERNRLCFAEEMSAELAIPVTPVETPERLADGADVVYVATNSDGAVVVDDAALGDVPVVLSIGSTIPSQRELDADVLASAKFVVVDTLEVLEESGDAIAALEAGLDRGRVELLGNLLAGPPVEFPQRTVYKSIGSPEQDVVLAAAILEEARRESFGRTVPSLSAIKWNL